MTDYPNTGTSETVAMAAARLDPDKLLFVRRDLLDVDPEMRDKLIHLLARSADPAARADNVEYLLLTMHQAREIDGARYLREVFVPWTSLIRRTELAQARVGEECARMSEFAPDSPEDMLHTVNIYRSMVADLVDPYLTLLVASYQFIESRFVSIDDANLENGERTKVDYLAKRIRDTGGPAALLRGYDPIVRNAVSHSGSEGVAIEKGSVLFRNIKRGSPPTVEARRWSNDDVRLHVVDLVEMVWSINAAVQVFGVDCLDLFGQDFATFAQMMALALTPAQRADIRRKCDEAFARIRDDATLSPKEKLDNLSESYFEQLALRGMPAKTIGVKDHRFITFVEGAAIPGTDQAIKHRAAELIRYLIVARAVYGGLYSRFVVIERAADETPVMSAALDGAALDDYAEERAGLIDLMREADLTLGAHKAEIEFDESLLAQREDASVGERGPRRGRTTAGWR